MSWPNGRWTLPGPARFVDELCDAVYRDRVVTVRVPVSRGDLAVAMGLRFNDHGQYRVVSVRPESRRNALEAIADAAGAGSGPPAALVTSPELHECVIVLELEAGHRVEPSLMDFARLTARPSGRGEPVMIVLGDGRVDGVGGKPPREARDVLGPLDCAASLAARSIEFGPFERRLVASIAMETAGWDVDVLTRLATLPIAAAVRPDLAVEAWADDRLTGWKGSKADWISGSLDDWGGTRCEHPLWLAANLPKGLSKRVWQGQVAVLLPWIENRRLEVIARFRQHLRPDPVRCGPDVESLDWGPIENQLRSRIDGPLDMVETHRKARNGLAHGCPLDWLDISRCLAGARRWSTR